MLEVAEKRTIHYSWFVLVAAFLIVFYSTGICYDLMSIFIAAIEKNLILSKTATSAIMSIIMFSGACSTIFAGIVYKKFSIKAMNCIYMLMMAAGFVCLSFAKSAVYCYAAALLTGIGFGGGGMVPVSLLLTNWFDQKRGLDVGIASTSSGIAMIVLPVIVERIIAIAGVMHALQITALTILVLGIIVTIIIQDVPQKKNCLPYGFTGDGNSSTNNNGKTEKHKLHFKTIFTEKRFWQISITVFLAAFVTGPTISMLPSFLQSAGYSLKYSAYIMSLFGISMIFGKIIYGAIIDKFGNRIANIYGFVVVAVMVIFGMNIGIIAFAPIAVGLLMGMGISLTSVAPPIWVGDFFSKDIYTEVYPLVNFFSSMGASAGLIAYGFLADVATFRTPYALSVLVLAAGFFVIQTAYRGVQKKQAPEMTDELKNSDR